jgi:hypothetical protein
LKDVKSPELRAVLRRLGSPIDDQVDDQVDTNTTSHPENRTKHASD